METDELISSELLEGEDEPDPLLAATLQLEQAAHYLDLEDWILHRMRQSERELTLNLQILRTGGDSAGFNGLRVQHYMGGMPTLGPLRLARDADPHWARATAMEASWQLSLLELPFGGAAGAILCEPAELGESELQELIRAYAAGLHGVAGPFSDILTPGEGCNEQIMAWMAAPRAKMQADVQSLAAVVGKPASLWGLPGYYDAVAAGVFSVLRLARGEKAAGGSLRGHRIAIQGLGAIGGTVVKMLSLAGAQLVAAADTSGGICNPSGLDIEALGRHLRQEGILFGFSGAEAVRNSDVLEAQGDVLVLAATERQITIANAHRINVPLVIEATHGAVTHAAEQQLVARGIKVIPWLVAGAGALIAAHHEWVQNTHPQHGDLDLREAIDSHLQKLCANVNNAAREHGTSFPRAALVLAIARVAEQMRLSM